MRILLHYHYLHVNGHLPQPSLVPPRLPLREQPQQDEGVPGSDRLAATGGLIGHAVGMSKLDVPLGPANYGEVERLPRDLHATRDFASGCEPMPPLDNLAA